MALTKRFKQSGDEMYNKYLDVFVCVAKAGSFPKASQQLFISPNAVMKQINNLERQLDVKLFHRTHHGLSLTPAGKLIYKDSLLIIKHSNETLVKAKLLMKQDTHLIRVGSSLMRPGQYVVQLWQRIQSQNSQLSLQIVPFNDNYANYLSLIHHLGQKIDIIYGIYPSSHFDHQVNVLPLGQQRLACAVPRTNPLAKKKQLQFSDLDKQKVVMIQRGDTEYIDRLRDDIEQNHHDIEIVDVDHYDVDTMNFCEENNLIMITADIWHNIHPALKTTPVDWNYTVPYGIIYPQHPTHLIKNFIKTIHDNISHSVPDVPNK